MSLNDRIKEARLSKNLTQEQLAALIGVAKTTVTGYEKGTSQPSIETLAKIMEALEIDANYLWQDETDFNFTVSYKEMNSIKKYRNLDVHGKELVTLILDKEYERVTDNKNVTIIQEEKTPYKNITSLCMYPYVLGGASAGATSFMTDIDIETVKAPLCPGADFIIQVSGDSMEPTFYDGDKVYVKKMTSLDIGDVGIFMINGSEVYIKELGKNGLISHNQNYKTIKPAEFKEIQVIGKVLGKV